MNAEIEVEVEIHPKQSGESSSSDCTNDLIQSFGFHFTQNIVSIRNNIIISLWESKHVRIKTNNRNKQSIAIKICFLLPSAAFQPWHDF